jgi:hypothetical protein
MHCAYFLDFFSKQKHLIFSHKLFLENKPVYLTWWKHSNNVPPPESSRNYICFIQVFGHNSGHASMRARPLGNGQKCRGLTVGVEHVFIMHEIQYLGYRFKSNFTMYNTDGSWRCLRVLIAENCTNISNLGQEFEIICRKTLDYQTD